jgi:uncharacterized membrane protein YqiK
MALLMVLLGLILAGVIVAGTLRLQNKPARTVGFGAALGVLVVFFLLGSVTYVAADEVGIVTKNALGPSLKEGRIIAVDGEMGVQADVLAPGWHVGYWPILYSVRSDPLTEIKSDEVGLVETADGLPMAEGQLFAEDWPRESVQQMLDARHFLTAGKGLKGKQATVLTPGKYRLNTQLYRVKSVKQTEILQGEVGVLKANYGKPASISVGRGAGDDDDGNPVILAGPGEMGIRKDVLLPGKYPLNTEAYTLIEMWTTEMVAQFASLPATKSEGGRSIESGQQSLQKSAHASPPEEREITVRTSDGFTFPVDVRLEYFVSAENAPLVVSRLGDDEGDRFRNALNSAVRAIFRNNAEKVRALDYVQQRSAQETQSQQMLSAQLARYGLTVTAVRIGNVGDEASLGALLKTQTDRELAKQEQATFQEQQKAAEQKKALSKVVQESEEEKKLATAAYSVKIAEEMQKQRVTEAEGEAEAITIKAEAQAKAYQKIAEQIGKSNAAMIELLKIVGERNITITPRIMVHGSTGDSGVSTALFGTVLDQMVKDDEAAKKPAEPARKPE